MFRGTYTAIVTPFRDGAIDETALEQLVEWQIASGITGIVAVGTTGESPTLDNAEHTRAIELTVKAARGRCTVIGGTGSNSTAEAISLTAEAEQAGADAALLVAPYYNKPTQEGLFRHFQAVAARTKLPIILYSIPGRCGIEIAVDTAARLARACPNIVSIKEAGGSVERVNQLRAALPPEFSILSGDDSLTLPFMSVGAEGVISVASNIIPREMAEMVRAFAEGRAADAREAHTRFYPLFRDLFIESNPIPIKTALSLAGRISASFACRSARCLPPMRRSSWYSAQSQPRQITVAASDTAPLRLLINGAKGRMGQAIIACAKLDAGVQVIAEVDVGDDFAAALAGADAVIEFSHHTVTPPVARACAAAGKLLVIGTTGHTDTELGLIRAAGESIPLVFAPNFSVGVNALFWLTEKAAEILGPDLISKSGPTGAFP